MNNPKQTTFAQWCWFIFQTALIGVFVSLSSILRVIMIQLHAQYERSAQFPWITHVILFGGPLHEETIYATVIFVLATIIGAGLLIKEPQKSIFMTQAPITMLWLSLIYLTTLNFVFLLSSITIDKGLYSSANPPPPSPIPASNIPPLYWLIGSIVYVVSIVVIVTQVRIKRKAEVTTSV